MPDLSAVIGGVRLPSLLMNASGPDCTTREQLATLAHSSAGAVVTKSMTLEPRAGNAQPRYRDLPLGSIRTFALPRLSVWRSAALSLAIDTPCNRAN